MDSRMTIPAERQKVTHSVVSPLGSRLDMMNLEMPVATAELAGKLIPPKNLDHKFFLAQQMRRRISGLECPARFHAGALAGCSSPMPAR